MSKLFKKPTKEDFKKAVLMGLLVLIASPVFAAIFFFFSPSVSESTNPSLGECGTYNNGIFVECLTMKEAYLKCLLYSVIIFPTLVFIGTLFLKEENTFGEEEEKK